MQRATSKASMVLHIKVLVYIYPMMPVSQSYMRLFRRYSSFSPRLAAALLVFLACQTEQEETEDPSPHSSAELIPEVESIRPGEPFTVGLRLKLDPGWHSYWRNPGDAGQPASIDWELPEGFAVGGISWPYPKKVEETSVVSYGYDNEVMLLTEITPRQSVTTGQKVTVMAQAHWLVCKNICLPAMADLEFEIDVSDEEPAANQRWRRTFEHTRNTLPAVDDGWRMSAEQTDGGYDLHLRAATLSRTSFEGAFFYISERGVLDHGAEQTISQAPDGIRISLVRSRYAREDADGLEGVLVIPGDPNSDDGAARAILVDAAVTPRTDEN